MCIRAAELTSVTKVENGLLPPSHTPHWGNSFSRGIIRLMNKLTLKFACIRFVRLSGLAFLLACCNSLLGQDIVGVLPELLKPEVAERLELTEEQTAGIRSLISQRMGAAVGLGQQLRGAPMEQQAQIRANFNAESEKLGLALLNPTQQAEFKKIRITFLGLLSLEEPEIAKEVRMGRKSPGKSPRS